jgi:cell wall-associated NlpC family hydrolase
MPSTAAGLGVTDPFDPKQNLMGGAKFLRGLLDRFNGDVSKALAGYNAGPGAVEKYGGIPPYAETQAYVPKVLGFVDEYGGLAATGAPAAQPMAAEASVNTAGIPAGYALVPLSALGLQAAGATTALVPATAVSTPTLPAPSTRGAQALGVARQYLGTPYRWGGESPATGFDCSGLMQYAFKQLGVSIPRVSQDQYRSGQQVPREALQPGDLVFFSKAGDVHHVGMYVGDGKFLHAPRTGDVVKISSLSEPHYAAEYCGARRYG